LITPVGDTQAFTAGLNALLARPAALRTMGDAGRNQVRGRADPANVVNGLRSIYQMASGAK
jgi:hypothetical protein